MPSAPLTTAEGLEPGSVLLVSKYLTPRTGDPYWWKTFRVVLDVNRWGVDTMILRMQIDEDKDFRQITIPTEGEVCQLLSDSEVPQGVAAMLMKHISKGVIKVVPF